MSVVLPGPERPFRGTIAELATDATPARPEIDLPPGGRPERRGRDARRRGVRRRGHVRRSGADAGPGPGGRAGRHVQPVPHDGPVLADPGRAPDRPQPPQRPHGRDLRDRLRLPGLRRDHPAQHGDRRRDPPAQRLQHGDVRQGPRHAHVGDEPRRPVRPLAHRAGLRALLRLPGRRGVAVGTGALRPDDADRAVCRARRLPPDGGPGRSHDRVDAPPEGGGTRQAVLRLLLAGRHARAAPCLAGVDRAVPRPVRRRLGRAPRADPRPTAGARDHSRRGRS